MKNITIVLTLSLTLSVYAKIGDDSRRLRAENECRTMNIKMIKDANEVAERNISDHNPSRSWYSNTTNNDVKVLICTDSAMIGGSAAPAFREFHFSSDGRLLSISEIKEVRFRGKFNKLASITNCECGNRNTQDRDRQPAQSSKPSLSER